MSTLRQNVSNPIISNLFILVCVFGLIFAGYMHWDDFVSATVTWQKELHGMLASHMRAVSDNALQYGEALIALSFGYGVFHAIGPGHGKAVIVTYLGSNKQSAKKGIYISFFAAILQAVVAIALVAIIAKLLKFKLSEVHNYGNDIALASYILIMLLGLMLLVGVARQILKRRKIGQQDRSFHVHDNPSSSNDDHEHINGHGHGHSHSHEHHGTECSCSHKHTHLPKQDESIWQTLTIIMSMGLRPCSGAIVVLIYAHLVGVYIYGVVATLMMAVGTGLSISLLALATVYVRSKIERLASLFTNKANTNGEGNRADSQFALPFSLIVKAIGGLILIALGWSLYETALVMSSGHPLF